MAGAGSRGIRYSPLSYDGLSIGMESELPRVRIIEARLIFPVGTHRLSCELGHLSCARRPVMATRQGEPRICAVMGVSWSESLREMQYRVDVSPGDTESSVPWGVGGSCVGLSGDYTRSLARNVRGWGEET